MKKTLLAFLTFLFLTNYLMAQISSFTVHDIATPELSNETGANPWFIDSGNLNGPTDNFPDIVIGTYSGNTVEIYINNEDGTFADPIVKPLSFVYGIQIADLDGDDYNDIIASGAGDSKLVWYRNNGDGTFADEAIILTGIIDPGNIVTGKIDDDDTIDIALVVYDFSGSSDRVIWLANDGMPWTEQDIIPAGDNLGPGDLDIGDVDNDGDLDVVVAHLDEQTIELYYNNWNPGVDDNPVSFTESAGGDISVNETYNYLFDVSFANIDDDLDNDLDILVVDLLSTRIAYYQNDGTGTSFTYQLVNNMHENLSQAEGIDFNNNGKIDIVAVDGLNGSDNDVIWFESDNIGDLNDGTPIVDNPYDNQIYGFTLNDFDFDGDIDIATLGFQSSRLRWIENQLPTLGVSNSDFIGMSVYPNPTKGYLNFNFVNSNPVIVYIYDVLGNNIFSQTVSIDTPLDVSELSNGVYTIRIDQNNESLKFIKQ